MKKIDGHRHVCCPDATVAANKIDPVKSISIYPPGIQKETEEINRRKSTDWNRKLGAFDENRADLKAAGMDRAVLQPTQTMFFYWAEPSAGAELARMVNEYTATGVRRHPQEFVGLATVPLQDVERAVQELSYATRELGLKGVVVGSNVKGHGFDEEQFWPFFEKIQELDIPIFIHPNDPAGTERVRRYYIINFLAYPLESTITAAQLVFGGILDRYPKLKICLSHAGGVLPFLLGRLEHGQSVRPEAQASCKNPFHHYLKNFYVDSITHWPETLRFVLNIMPKGHVFMGTDYPYDMADNHPVSSVRAAISKKEIQEEIFGKNLNAIVDFS